MATINLSSIWEIRAVSILLVNGFLVIPAASARLICRQFVPFLATAAGIDATCRVMETVISVAIYSVVRVLF